MEGRERNINVWLPLECPLLGTWPTTQACALTGNITSDPLVHRPALNPLSHTSQGCFDFCFWKWFYSVCPVSFKVNLVCFQKFITKLLSNENVVKSLTTTPNDYNSYIITLHMEPLPLWTAKRMTFGYLRCDVLFSQPLRVLDYFLIWLKSCNWTSFIKVNSQIFYFIPFSKICLNSCISFTTWNSTILSIKSNSIWKVSRIYQKTDIFYKVVNLTKYS